MNRTKHSRAISALVPRRRHLVGAISTAMIAALFTLVLAPAASADTVSTGFESGFTNGSPNGQQGWSSTGSAGSGCATYDHAIVDNTYGVAAFGTKSLRISNAVTSGCFSDQTFSASTLNEAGEAGALNGGLSGGTRQPHFDASFDLASVIATVQPGMYVSVSPDRGDGARMSYLRFEDQTDGIHVFFDDYTTGTGFSDTDIATLSRAAHRIRFSMDFIDGPSNDVVKIYIDGVLKTTGTSWEDYFRDLEDGFSRTVDSLLFRTGGTCPGQCVPANAGNGFLFDNISLNSSSGPFGVCEVIVTPGTATSPTLYDLDDDCVTDQTIVVPQNAGGSIFDGHNYSITGIDPADHFLGAVVQAEPGAKPITVKNLTVTVSNLKDACDAGADRLRGIMFESVSGTINNNVVTDIEQGTNGESGCQEGQAIEVRNSPFTTGGTDTQVTISNNVTTDYQKTGILANGSVAVTITGNIVTGDGPIGYIAQNGIQVGFGGTAVVKNNTMKANFYTGPDDACGLLLFMADGVKASNNKFAANEVNQCNAGKGGGKFKPSTA